MECSLLIYAIQALVTIGLVCLGIYLTARRVKKKRCTKEYQDGYTEGYQDGYAACMNRIGRKLAQPGLIAVTIKELRNIYAKMWKESYERRKLI